MRLRYLLPIAGLLALGACKDEKKAENTPAPPSAKTTAPEATAAPAQTTNPSNSIPASKTADH